MPITKSDFEKRRTELESKDYKKLEKLYRKAIKEDKIMTAWNIFKIMNEKYGVGDDRSGADYGNLIE